MDQKAKVIISVFVFAAIVLMGKMAQLQLISCKYKEQAQRTTLGKNIIYPSRGLIYDRKNNLVVSNTTIYDIEVIYNNLPKQIDTLGLCKLLNIDPQTFTKNIQKDWSKAQYSKSIPFIFLSKVDPKV